MPSDLVAQFNDPATVARYLGESVGTHYSAALRAAEAYSRHLAPRRRSLTEGSIDDDKLLGFWQEVLEAERVRVGSPGVVRGLGASPDHFLFDFLDSADQAFQRRYQNGDSSTGKAPGKSEHENCLRFLRDNCEERKQENLIMRNKVTTWLQLLRLTGRYQE